VFVPPGRPGTLKNLSFTCPACGDVAIVPPGDYTEWGTRALDALRQADLTEERLRQLANAAKAARAAAMTPESFASAHPDAAPLVRIVSESAGQYWLLVLLAVLQIVIPLLHTEATTTRSLRDQQMHTLAAEIATRLGEADRPSESAPRAEKPPKRKHPKDRRERR
jgi:hypothetical protein